MTQVDLTAKLGVSLPRDLLTTALTHRSYANEYNTPNNERLEFLGDSVLQLAITDTLYRRFPDKSESDLSKLRSSIVNTQALASISRSLNLGQYLRLGRGEIASGGADKDSILADGMESLLGAIYLHCGIDVARQVISQLFDNLLDGAVRHRVGLDYKTALQELASKRRLESPSYTTSFRGPDHDRVFTANVKVGSVTGKGYGRSKKLAEQSAAQMALTRLESIKW